MYSRFETLQKFGKNELQKIKDSKVAIVGLGATGSVIAEHLARHGANLVLIDRDYLEHNDIYSSNIYTLEDCEKSIPKAVAAKEYLEQFTNVESYVRSLNSENVELLKDSDLLIDGTDNMETRFLINEFSKKEDTAWIYTAVIGEKGYSMLFDENCFNCIFDSLQAGALETCETSGVLRETSTIAASFTSSKAVHYLAENPVEERLDTVSGESFEISSPGCTVCDDGNYPHLESLEKTTSVCGENKYQIKTDISENGFEKIRKHGKIISDNEYVLRAEIKNKEIALFRSGRVIVEAKDSGHAESFVSEIVGV